ncbi:diacylglycerol kinase family lipid kinase [Leekyejoonella antrihumi]|uniref:Diacylglycerol kinase family lipid kinase n=1 Tax=Leekyejoonella antrihumi TaxID=1660198 RepID=A0A563EBC5_9MICO|nr:diacylglycerol kinase family lipid kinase [Leekyejoonella antrihumi]
MIINPQASGGRAVQLAAPAIAALRAAGADPRITHSPGITAADDLVRESVAAGETVVAVGGDGMVSSLADAVVRHGATFAIMPVGRGNDFARQLGIPPDPARLATVLLEAEPVRVDAIEVSGRVVVGSVYAGVDSQTSDLVNSVQRIPALLQYPYGAVRALATFPRTAFRVTVDDEVHEYEGFSVVAANSGYYGKGMHIAPDAGVHDGLFDVVMIAAGNRARFIANLPRVYRGTHVTRPEVAVVRGSVVTIEAEGVPAYADGERLSELPVTATMREGALSILTG